LVRTCELLKIDRNLWGKVALPDDDSSDDDEFEGDDEGEFEDKDHIDTERSKDRNNGSTEGGKDDDDDGDESVSDQHGDHVSALASECGIMYNLHEYLTAVAEDVSSQQFFKNVMDMVLSGTLTSRISVLL
jgi:cobalamin biosynthesis protein CobT